MRDFYLTVPQDNDTQFTSFLHSRVSECTLLIFFERNSRLVISLKIYSTHLRICGMSIISHQMGLSHL